MVESDLHDQVGRFLPLFPSEVDWARDILATDDLRRAFQSLDRPAAGYGPPVTQNFMRLMRSSFDEARATEEGRASASNPPGSINFAS